MSSDIRKLSGSFFNDLKDGSGALHPLLERIQRDDTLMLAIRKNYVNIYYRGGNLLKIEAGNSGRSYRPFFDPEYAQKPRSSPPPLPTSIESANDAAICVDAIPRLKEIMDFYFAGHPKPEREFQQLVARENNRSTISNETEYFVTDIEFADSDCHARFDMLAVCWPASDRRNGNRCRAALIEMKYGDRALGGGCGLPEHLKGIKGFIQDRARYEGLLETMESQFQQLDALELLDYHRSQNGTRVRLDPQPKPELIVILANHNPRSLKLGRVLQEIEAAGYAESQDFDLRFAVTTCAGYGLHANCLLSLAKLQKILARIEHPDAEDAS